MIHTRLVSGLAVLLLAGACGDASGPEPSRLGRYRLARINGVSPPAFVAENPRERYDFLAGSLHLRNDGTFIDSTDLKVTPHGGTASFVTDVGVGTYRITNDSVFFTTSGGLNYLMVYLSFESLRQDVAGSILIYTR